MSRLALLANAVSRRLDRMFPGYFPGAKHNHYADFGFPVDPTFIHFYEAYERNGLAAAAVNKTIAKTWQDSPLLQEKERDGSQPGATKETRREGQIRERFDDLRLWQRLAEADRRGMVGAYAGVIMRLADSKPLDQPVEFVPGGLSGLVELIPAWEGQLKPAEWDNDQQSPTYGWPTMYQFQESAVKDGSSQQPRDFRVHPDRVLIWSKDGTINGRSALKAGYNDLMTIEKIVGAGGEGFWKNAKSAPVIEVDPAARLEDMAKAMGIPVDELADKMNEQVEDWQRGFDKLLMLQGMKADVPQITLPSPEHFFLTACQSFAASISIPMKILVGSQTGERASTEDADEWAQTNMARRAEFVRPNIMDFIRRLERFGILPERDWHLEWADLTEASMGEKIDRVGKMALVNKNATEIVFTGDDLRGVVGMEPLPDDKKLKPMPAAPADPHADPADPKDDPAAA
jgi:hypothetical protein